jgi:hypothetical protein
MMERLASFVQRLDASDFLWAAGIFLLTFSLSLGLFAALVVLLPPRYFVGQRSTYWTNKPPLLKWLAILGKNLLGVLIILLGIGLSLPGIPGQGLLTVLIGVMLLSIPGKRRLVRRIVRRPRTLRSMNRLRAWFGRPPLVVD